MDIAAWPVTLGSTGNPYPEALYSALRERGHTTRPFTRWGVVRRPPDIVHVHWPENVVQGGRSGAAALRACVVLAALLAARLRGARIVWTVHNAAPHEPAHPLVLRAYRSALTRLLGGWISLGEASREAIWRAHPALRGRRSFVVRHGDYRGWYPAAPERRAAREAAGIAAEEVVLLFFGQVRAYKGVPELLAAFRGWEHPGARLVVAGRPESAEFARELTRAVDDPRVELRLRFVPDPELAELFALSDLVVLPFRRVLNSGSALLGLSFSRRLLLPEEPAFCELQAIVGPHWVRTYSGPLSAAHLSAAIEELPAPEVPLELSAFAWSAIAEQTEEAFRAIRAPRGGARRRPRRAGRRGRRR